VKPILLFLHIPKTAGTTIRDILKKTYGGGLQVGGLEHNIHDRFPTDETLSGIEERFKDKNAFTLHMCFGLHAYLQRPHHYLTFLREPIQRSISHYNFFVRMRENIVWHDVVKRGITAFHTEGHIQWRNMQTRFLAGREVVGKEVIDETDLELAKQNLRDEIELLGIVERFDESVLYCQHQLDWDRPFYLKANQSKRVLKDKTITYASLNSDEKKMIEHVNRYDLELYDYAKQLFQNRLDASEIDYERELARFSFYNRIYYFKTVTQNKMRSILRHTIKEQPVNQ
jgi:hypothetical protein